MRMALEEAQAAADAGETPVGAVVVDPALGSGDDAVVARGRNRTVADRDPTAHAEVVALRAAALARGNHRLTGLDLYVTLEPCPMCAGALGHARIGRVVFAASDPKGGGVLHGARVFDHPQCHWRPAVEAGPLAGESAEMLRAFFRARRGRLRSDAG